MARKVSEIAQEIFADMQAQKKSARAGYPAAYPYLDAMLDIQDIGGMYGHDTAASVVRYFLANASTWRGEVARRIKAELKALLPE